MENGAKPIDVTVTSLESSGTKGSVPAGEKSADQKSEATDTKTEATRSKASRSKKKSERSTVQKPNRVRESRIESMMSKAELARRANLSVLTIDRVEKGFGCRMHTKRKILEALGLSLADRVRVFGEEEE
jgi:ribosome-binding protein aMBF1 (putative translation factor)